MELRLQAGFAATRAMPDVRVTAPDEVVLPSRTYVEGRLPNRGGFRSVGVSADLALAVRPHLTVPIFGIGVYLPVGSHAPVRTAVDGSIATIEPWRLVGVDLLGPGIGVRTIKRRYFVEGLVRLSLHVLTGRSVIAAGTETVDVGVHGLAPGVRAEISACRRLDPESRLCLTVAPRLFEVVPLAGVTAGLTWVWGN